MKYSIANCLDPRGIKGVPLNAEVVLVSDELEPSLDFYEPESNSLSRSDKHSSAPITVRYFRSHSLAKFSDSHLSVMVLTLSQIPTCQCRSILQMKIKE